MLIVSIIVLATCKWLLALFCSINLIRFKQTAHSRRMTGHSTLADDPHCHAASQLGMSFFCEYAIAAYFAY